MRTGHKLTVARDKMTYKELLKELQTLSTEQLGQDVTVHLSEVGEYVPVYSVCVAVGDEDEDEDQIVLGN
jgi:hypothetical protein